MSYYSTKTYGHERGLSAAFRQPRATHSHCCLLHGYALSFSFEFKAEFLDDKNWVIDFGGLKELKDWLEDNFDHKTAVDAADHDMALFEQMDAAGMIELRVFDDGVGCEKFAYYAWRAANQIVHNMSNGRCVCTQVEVREHGANSAIYKSVEFAEAGHQHLTNGSIG